MKGKLIPFPTTPKDLRLLERAKIVSKNFSDSEFGMMLMDFMLISIYNQFKDGEDFYSEQVCAKVIEARAYIEIFQGENDEES